MTRDKRVYTPKATTEEEGRIASLWDGPTFEGPLAMAVTYTRDGQYVELRSLPDGYYTPLTADVDNLLKLTLDALQKAGAFVNDRQVMHLAGIKQ